MTHRLFLLDVPENTPIVAVAQGLPGIEVGMVGHYFVITAQQPFAIDRRATGVRHAVWYSCVGALEGGRIVQWDKDALRVEPA
jgi:hypothetical protein